MQRLDPAPGAEVEGPGDGPADHRSGQRDGGHADPEHVVGVDGAWPGVRVRVGDHQEVGVVVGMRADVQQRPHAAPITLQNAGLKGCVDSGAGQGALSSRAQQGRHPRGVESGCPWIGAESVDDGQLLQWQRPGGAGHQGQVSGGRRQDLRRWWA